MLSEELLNNNRIGITYSFLKEVPKRKSFHMIIDILNKKKKEKMPIGTERFSILDVDWDSSSQKLKIYSWIEVPIIWNKIPRGSLSPDTKLMKDYEKKNVSATLDMKEKLLIIYSPTHRLSKRFINKMRDITTGRLNCFNRRISPEVMRKKINNFDVINGLTIEMYNDDHIKLINLKGRDVIGSDICKKFYSNNKNIIKHIVGIKEINEVTLRINFNRNGRLWINGKLKKIKLNSITNFINKFSQSITTEDVLKEE